MPILAANSPESFALSIAVNGTCAWTVSYIAHRQESNQQVESSGCFQGLVSGTGVISLLSPLSAQPFVVPPPSVPQQVPYSRELQFVSVQNQSNVNQTVVIGKLVVLGTVTTFYPFSAVCVLGFNETLTYVRGAGFQLYTAAGVKK